jgi:hypothetical protein
LSLIHDKKDKNKLNLENDEAKEGNFFPVLD